MTPASALHQFLFGIYPYIALAVFVLGSLARFDGAQYTWKSDSSQLLRKRELRWGSNLFHFGILVVFFGHLFGFLIPESISGHFMTPAQHLWLSMVGGGIAGVVALAGLTILIHRRLVEPRIHAVTRTSDIAIVVILWIQLALGMWTVYAATDHLDGAMFMRLVDYVQGIVIFRGGNADLLIGVPWVYRAHIVLGLTIFLIFPFTRMVHIWSGFATGELVVARHILFHVAPCTPIPALRDKAETTLSDLLRAPDRFESLARECSNCPSAQHGGNLGQIQRGEMVPEFEQVLFNGTWSGIHGQLVKTRYGFHIVAVDQRAPGRRVPFDAVQHQVAERLRISVLERALAQFVAVLAGQADVRGVDLGATPTPLVQ